MDVPTTVGDLVAQWRAVGSPLQPPIAWPRDRWVQTFPSHQALLEGLPDQLSRPDVTAYGRLASHGAREAETAFLVVMAWGFGSVGYGPWRTRRILESTVESARRLSTVAHTLTADGALSAYAELALPCRLRWLGPAFGTKFLHFCSASCSEDTAIVLDRLVTDWLRSNTGLSLNPIPWSVPTYGRYLEHLGHWSAELAVTATELECCIFQAEANRREGSQWAQP